MRKSVAVLLLLVLAGVCFYLFFRQGRNLPGPTAASSSSFVTTVTNSAPPITQQQPAVAPEPPPANPVASPTLDVASPPPPAPLSIVAAQALPPPDPSGLPPATVLEHMRTAIQNYNQVFGGNPVGTNPEITKVLNGGNPRQIQFISPESGLRINDSGELVDSWGTPFFFHQLSAKDMEIRSAGPDRKMWTSDDLVIK